MRFVGTTGTTVILRTEVIGEAAGELTIGGSYRSDEESG